MYYRILSNVTNHPVRLMDQYSVSHNVIQLLTKGPIWCTVFENGAVAVFKNPFSKTVGQVEAMQVIAAWQLRWTMWPQGTSSYIEWRSMRQPVLGSRTTYHDIRVTDCRKKIKYHCNTAGLQVRLSTLKGYIKALIRTPPNRALNCLARP